MENTQNIQKVKKTKLLGWGIGDFGFQLMISVSVSYFALFLTDYANFPVALSGMILSVVGIGDAVTQPFSGVLVTKMNMKWGKYRSWYLVGPPIVAVFFILGYTRIGSDTIASAIIIVTYVVARFSFNCIWSAHLALIPYISQDPEDRAFLSASRGMYQTVASIIFSAVSLSIMTALVGIFGNVNGVTVTAALFSLFMIGGYFVSYLSTKGVNEPTEAAGQAKEKVAFSDYIKSIFTNRPLLVLTVAELFRSTANFMFTIYIAHYWKYTTNVFAMMAVFMTILNVTKFVGAAMTAWIAAKIGPKNTYLFGSLGCGIAYILAYFFAANTTLFTVFCVLAFVCVALPAGITSLMFTHVGMYAQWKTGKDNRAFVTGLIGFPIKIASFLKGALMAFGMSAMGFVANVEIVPQSMVDGIYWEVAVMPGIWSLLSAFFIIFYSLNNKAVKEMSDALEAKKA